MDWIDVPVVEVITYFTEISVYFMHTAVQLGVIIGILGIAWSSIQMAFGTLEVQKALVGTITKFIFFMMIITFYPAVVTVVRNVAVEMGSNASDKPQTKIKDEFERFLGQLEAIVAQEDNELAADLAAAVAARERFATDHEELNEVLKKYDGLGVSPTEADFDTIDARIARTEELIEARKTNPKGNMKTVLAIKSVLKPVDRDGNITDESNAANYILDLSLKDKNGNQTGYISPNAMLRVALLSAQIMWEKEWTTVTEEWQTNDDAGFWSGMTKTLSIAEFPMGRIFNIILTFLTMIAIVCAMAFSLIQYVMAIVEFTITVSVAIICVPFMLMDGLKDIANKVLPAILAQAVKLTMITLCMFYGVWAFLGMAMNVIGESEGFSLTTFTYVIFTILLAFVLTQNAPKLALALLNGQPQLSMGELVAAMGTAAAVGGGAVAAMKTAGSAVQKGVPAAARATMNRVGDASAIARAGSAASGKMGEMGGSSGQQGMAGARAMAGEAGYRMKQGLSSAFHGAAHHGMQGGGQGGAMGGMGSGFSGENRFDYNDGKTRDASDRPGNSMKYGRAQDDKGRALTGGEFVRAQGDAAAARALGNMKAPSGTHAARANMVAQSSYTGLDYTAPKMLPAPPDRKALPQSNTIYL